MTRNHVFGALLAAAGFVLETIGFPMMFKYQLDTFGRYGDVTAGNIMFMAIAAALVALGAALCFTGLWVAQKSDKS